MSFAGCFGTYKREHLDAWLNPDPLRLDDLDAILEDRNRPYYEHRFGGVTGPLTAPRSQT